MCIYRYVEGSTKEATRRSRDKGLNKVYTLRTSTRLSPQKVILNVNKSKMQLIDLIVADLTVHKTDFQTHTLVVVGSDPIPVEILKGSVCKCHELTTTHEEDDTINIKQVARVKAGTILVVGDDTDIYILLLHFCHLGPDKLVWGLDHGLEIKLMRDRLQVNSIILRDLTQECRNKSLIDTDITV